MKINIHWKENTLFKCLHANFVHTAEVCVVYTFQRHFLCANFFFLSFFLSSSTHVSTQQNLTSLCLRMWTSIFIYPWINWQINFTQLNESWPKACKASPMKEDELKQNKVKLKETCLIRFQHSALHDFNKQNNNKLKDEWTF